MYFFLVCPKRKYMYMDCFFKAIFGTWGKTSVKRIQVNITKDFQVLKIALLKVRNL